MYLVKSIHMCINGVGEGLYCVTYHRAYIPLVMDPFCAGGPLILCYIYSLRFHDLTVLFAAICVQHVGQEESAGGASANRKTIHVR